MENEAKTTARLTSELAVLHQEIANLKKSEAKHKQTVETLQKSEEYFRAITQNSSDLIIIVDIKASIKYANPSTERFLGYKPEEIIGKSAFSFIATADLPRAIYDFGKAILTKNVVIPNAFGVMHKDGLVRVLEGVGTNLLGDPVVAGFVMNVHDITKRRKAEEELSMYRKRLEDLVEERTSDLAKINSQLVIELTERKRAEEALKESEERFAKAFLKNSIPMAITTIKEGRYIDVNEAFLKTMGLKRDEIVGNTSTGIGYITREQRSVFLNEFKKKGCVENLELMVRTKRKELRYGLFNTTKINLANNDYLLTVVTDITERKLGEQERIVLEGRLHRAEKMESLGTLAGGVAHDLNNVLGVLVGYSELLMIELPEENPCRRHASNILLSSKRAAAIIQDLLTLARRGVAVSEVVNLNTVISDFFKTPEFERLKTYHPRVTFKNDLEKDLLNMKGSPVHLGKTVMNLVSNASEAISARGKVMIRTENRYLDKPLRGYDDVREGDYVVLTVSDDGKGIPGRDIEKIFEPFYTKKVMGRSGTGLGLTVVWGTVKDHDGYIDVQSKDGKGSTFTIYFPATREELTAGQQEISIEQYMGRGESILVVDDVKEQREVAASLLTKLGYKVHTVSSGEEAVAYLKTHSIDLVVLDMIMDPGIDGLETYQRVLKIKPKQKTVIVSGFSETDRVKKAQKLGAGAYVRKPYMLEKIGLALRKTLNQ